MKKEKKSTNKKESFFQNKMFRNYILLFFFILLGIGLTLYFCKIYNVYDEYQKATPVIQGSLSEITYEELNHYVIDNSSFVLYMCNANSEDCRYFEKDFKKYIDRNSLHDDIIYLNLSSADLASFVKEFNNQYKPKHKLTNHIPALVSFEDGKVDAILQEKKNKKLSMSKVKHFLDIIWAEEEEEEIEETGE